MGWASASEDAKQKEIGMINPIQKLREYYDIDCERWWSITIELVIKTVVLLLMMWYAFVFTFLLYTFISDVVTGEDSFSCAATDTECLELYGEYYYQRFRLGSGR